MTTLFDLITNGSVVEAGALLTGLDEQRRRQLGTELLAYVRRRRDNWWGGAEGTALAVSAVGCLPSAAKAADLLGRRSVRLDENAGPPVVDAARDRGVDWLPDLARRLADRLVRTDFDGNWSFVAHLLVAEKAPPPTGDMFVEGWLDSLTWPTERLRPYPLIDRLRADPFLDALLPRLFEVDGIGTRMAFQDRKTRESLALPHALIRLAAQGRLDRAALLHGCIDRLLRGDRPVALRPFVVLHDLLTPTPGERADRCADYLRLLADAPGPVASMAQKALRGMADVEFEAVLDASRAVLVRPEKALVRGQLGWLDQLARQRRDRAPEVAAVLAAMGDHPAVELRDRAAALAAKHGAAPAAVTVVVHAGDDLPAPPPPAPAPPPITDPDELAEEVATLLSTRITALGLERILDGVVRLAGTDHPRLTRALTPVLDRHPQQVEEHRWDPSCLHGELGRLLRADLQPTGTSVGQGWWNGLLGAARRSQAYDPRVAPAHRLLRVRLAEIGTQLGPTRSVGLLAAPTQASGVLDPSVLHDRLAALGDEVPWPWDLTQALLRLPPVVDDALADRAAALGTPGGGRLAAWLRSGGLPRPQSQVVTVRFQRSTSYYFGDPRLSAERVQVELSPPEAPPSGRGPDAERFDDPLGLLNGRVVRFPHHCAGWSLLWPAVLPGYRELVAAYALTDVSSAADLGVQGAAGVLPLIAECTGPGGVALDLALAYGLGARHRSDRAAAVDALLLLAAAGDLDPGAVGRQVGELGAGGMLTLTRCVEPLRDVAMAGARLSVWRLLAAALPALLAAPKPPRGTPDLLTLAAETATATGVWIEVPRLAEVAARGGASRLVAEARRLSTALDR
ncbi:hypothetical protein I0C86_16340 [Plantactinospora sp. S1510]|uniref:Secreted protein n=1 Tax=Plantactinospora alkalitolerans TaxID=2789879 RepID=A0ABS0GWC5_9ACTN|nr:DUF6493 family protein [Plantactinospora alkalitolerans]MBF9130518.1 hypothetical protein [Plantactinospora alkalitolerans]